MNIGTRVRVRKDHSIEFKINREQFGNFGREIETHGAMTGRVMPLTIWYGPEELEVIE